MKRVCIIGCGSIGSLYAAHLARVAEVWAFVRRADHATALNEQGLRVSGTHEFHVRLRATNDPSALTQFDFGIVACKATQTREAHESRTFSRMEPFSLHRMAWEAKKLSLKSRRHP